MAFEEIFPPHQLPVRSLCFRCPVEARELEQVTLASVDEVATFAVDKRRDEHLSGRWLLAQALDRWGLDPTQLEVRRTELRAPVLAYLSGIWVNIRMSIEKNKNLIENLEYIEFFHKIMQNGSK